MESSDIGSWLWLTVWNKVELGQMVSISKYRDTIRYRYQTSKYRSIEFRLDSTTISIIYNIDNKHGQTSPCLSRSQGRIKEEG